MNLTACFDAIFQLISVGCASGVQHKDREGEEREVGQGGAGGALRPLIKRAGPGGSRGES